MRASRGARVRVVATMASKLWRAGKRGQRSRHTLDAPPLEYVPAVQEAHVDAPASAHPGRVWCVRVSMRHTRHAGRHEERQQCSHGHPSVTRAAPPPRSIRLSLHSLPRFPARALFLRALTLSLGTHNTHQTALSFCRSLALARLRARALTLSLSLSLSLHTHRHTQNALHTHTHTQCGHHRLYQAHSRRTCTRVRARLAGGACR